MWICLSPPCSLNLASPNKCLLISKVSHLFISMLVTSVGCYLSVFSFSSPAAAQAWTNYYQSLYAAQAQQQAQHAQPGPPQGGPHPLHFFSCFFQFYFSLSLSLSPQLYLSSNLPHNSSLNSNLHQLDNHLLLEVSLLQQLPLKTCLLNGQSITVSLATTTSSNSLGQFLGVVRFPAEIQRCDKVIASDRYSPVMLPCGLSVSVMSCRMVMMSCDVMYCYWMSSSPVNQSLTVSFAQLPALTILSIYLLSLACCFVLVQCVLVHIHIHMTCSV